MPFFTIKTLGCKVNQYDSRAMASALAESGLLPLPRGRPRREAGLVVINTCCVTATAMRKSRQAIRRAVRVSPQAAVLVTGCYSDYDTALIRNVLADLKVPQSRITIAGHHSDLGGRLRRLARLISTGAAQTGLSGPPGPCGVGGNEGSMSADTRPAAAGGLHTYIRRRRAAVVKENVCGCRRLPPIRHFDGHQRAFVKVQDGCDAFCSYCVVPYMRWKVWSRSIDEVEDECRALVESGHREVVLCGVFLGAFGRETAVRARWTDGRSTLAELVRRIARIEGLWRVRLSSLEPADVTDELLAACRQARRVAPHFHLPLQSGSTRILRRMNRQYTVDDYLGAVQAVRRAFDRPAITTDIIAGFPGEGEADFAETLEVARRCGFAKIHAFGFSAVEGTAAWTYRHEAPGPEATKRRMEALSRLEADLARRYREQFVGEVLEGLVEGRRRGGGRQQAMTDRYQTVFFEGKEPVSAGRILRLKITGLCSGGLSGAACPSG